MGKLDQSAAAGGLEAEKLFMRHDIISRLDDWDLIFITNQQIAHSVALHIVVNSILS